jgi:EAL domain-containing protein (putative c-di-GMP-specific phosphodiesterase class I)
MPWVFRLGLGQNFDRAVVSEALKTLPSHKERLHVNLSADSLKGTEFSLWLAEKLKTMPENVARFGIEISETAIVGAQPSFERLMTVLKPYGCELGIEHMGYRPEIIASLGELGPSYLKIDSLYTQDLRSNEGNKAVVNSLSGVAKSLGIDCIVEGISRLDDREAAYDMGVRGASGTAIH